MAEAFPALAAGHPIRGPADRLARAVSIVCAPPTLALPLVLLAGQRAAGHPSFWPAVLTLVATTALLPTLFVYAAYRRGLIGDLDLSQRAERAVPAAFAALSAAGAYPVLHELGAPADLLVVSSALAAQLAGLALVTMRWKVSYHAAAAGGLAALACAIEGVSLGLALVGLAGLVAWSRVRLGRHTPAQVLVGLLSGVPVLWWVWPA